MPRFHITWGTGPGVIEPFVLRAQEAAKASKLAFRFRHQVKELVVENGAITGVTGHVLAEDDAERGSATNREVVRDFTLRAPTTLIASGGIGGNHDLVRKAWPERLGAPPELMVSGVPEHVDGLMLGIAKAAKAAKAAEAHLINGYRMWHYVEGIRNWDPIWPKHGIRILPGPSSLWLDAAGERLPDPNWPGFDTLKALTELQSRGHQHSWFILTRAVIKKEFALSGSEQNPDLTGKSWRLVAGRAFGPKATGSVEVFKAHTEDFVVADTLEDLVEGMNRIGDVPLSVDTLRQHLSARR